MEKHVSQLVEMVYRVDVSIKLNGLIRGVYRVRLLRKRVLRYANIRM